MMFACVPPCKGALCKMAAYRGAESIAALQERFLQDVDIDDDVYRARYGRDAPRFLNTGERTMRPTAKHLLAPLWRDSEGREYTPHDIGERGTTDVWWVRIPPGLTRQQRRAGNVMLTEFPQPGEQLLWRRVGGRVEDAATVVVVVSQLVEPKTASAQVVLAEDAPAQRTDAEKERLERREAIRERSRLARQRDAH